jgi:hypothetical protein
MSIQQMQMKYLRQADAEAIAKTNNDNDPDWTYEAKQASDGQWYIAVFDEDGELLGAL